MLGILPFYHIYGERSHAVYGPLLNSCLGAVNLIHYPFAIGLPVYIMPRFDAVQFCTNIQKYQITVSLVVPPVLVFLSRHPGTLFRHSRYIRSHFMV